MPTGVTKKAINWLSTSKLKLMRLKKSRKSKPQQSTQNMQETDPETSTAPPETESETELPSAPVDRTQDFLGSRCHGCLWKRSPAKHARWEERWFYIQASSHTLFYYDSESKFFKDKPAKGSI